MKKGLFVCVLFLILFSIWIPVNASPVESTSQADSTPTPSITSLGSEQISEGNLTEVAKLGYGPLQAVRFSADGTFFIAVSSYGLAKFSMEKINQKPLWIPFINPIEVIKDIQINKKGNQLKIYTNDDTVGFILVDLITGEIVDQVYEDNWTEKRNTDVNIYEGLSVTSPDNSLLFRSRISYKDITDHLEITQQSDEETVEEIYNNHEDKLLFPLGMKTQYIYFKDRSEPEGCDLEFFSPCGNSLMATPLAPFMAAFSDNNNYLAVRYRTTESNIWQKFQLVRIFNANNGKLLYSIGGAKQPVIDFAFQPGSRKIVVGFLDGSLQLWNSDGSSIQWQTKYFSEPANKVMVSNDGKYIVYEGFLGDIEVRKTIDGKILSNYKAVSAAISPKHNLLALGMENGMIQVEDLDKLTTVSRMIGHNKKILAMAFSPDEKILVSSGQDCAIYAWNTLTGKKLREIENSYISPYEDLQDVKSRVFIYSLNFIDNSDSILGFGSWGTGINWTVNTGKINYSVHVKDVESFPGMDSLEPHSHKLISVDSDKSMFNIYNQYFDLKSGNKINPENPDQDVSIGSTNIVCDGFGPVSNNKASKYSLGKNEESYFICAWDSSTKTIESVTSFFPYTNNSKSNPGDPILSPDNSLLYVPISDGVTFVFKVPD